VLEETMQALLFCFPAFVYIFSYLISLLSNLGNDSVEWKLSYLYVLLYDATTILGYHINGGRLEPLAMLSAGSIASGAYPSTPLHFILFSLPPVIFP
jgi:hypothetical protein